MKREILYTFLATAFAGICFADNGKGLWLNYRQFPANQCRAELPSNMHGEPREIWSYGCDNQGISYADKITISGKEMLVAAKGLALNIYDKDGSSLWAKPFIGFSGMLGILYGKNDPRLLINQHQDTLILLDSKTGRQLWSWTIPEGTHNFCNPKIIRMGQCYRIFIFPVGVENGNWGYCWEFSSDTAEPKLLWKQQYVNKFFSNYGPLYIIADMDNDGRDEIIIASKPAYVGVLNSNTGAIKFDCKYSVIDSPNHDIGRPYGLFEAVDLDNDGFKDIVMVSIDVEKYISVLKNQGGKSFKPLWSKFIDKEFPKNERDVRARSSSLADINGDGRKELVLGLFNITGDNKWHTIAIDPLKGFDAKLLDLPGRFFMGCYDFDGSGNVLVVTTAAKGRDIPEYGRIEIFDGKTGKFVAGCEGAQFKITSAQLGMRGEEQANAINFLCTRNDPVMVLKADGRIGLLCRKQGTGEEVVFSVAGSKITIEPFACPPLERVMLENQSVLRPVEKRDEFQIAKSPCSDPSVTGCLLSEADGKRELVLSLGEDKVLGLEPNLNTAGACKSKWMVKGSMPGIWRGNDGQRMVCTIDRQENSIYLSNPQFGQEMSEPIKTIKLPGVITPFRRALPYDDDGQFRVMGETQIGHHTYASAVYDINGIQIWSDPNHGPYPNQPGAADINGDGRTEMFVDDHGMEFIYDYAGRNKLFAAAWDEKIKGRTNGAAYAVPIIGPFGPGGQMRVIMSSALMAVEIVDKDGKRIANRLLDGDVYRFSCTSAAVGHIRDANTWQLGMVDVSGIFHCIDTKTAKDRWTIDTGCRLFGGCPVPIVACDLENSGREEFVAGLPNGSLIALAETSQGTGKIVWKKQFDSSINDCIAGDIDVDGFSEIILVTADGVVRVLK